MSQISKCPTLRVVLGYWEALGEVSEMRYNNLLYCSSKRSYCIIPAIAAMAAVVKSCSCTFSQVKGFSTQPSGCLWPDAAFERSVNSLAQIIKQLLCAVCCRANYKTAGAQIAELSHSHSRPLQLLLNCSSSCSLADRKGLCRTLLLGRGKVISRLLKS